MASERIGIIGGSGLYDLEGIAELEEVHVTTPFGEPSDAFRMGELAGASLVFLARHGPGHRLLPAEVNYRANIWGMKWLGVEAILSVSAVGSMREGIHPGEVVLPDQYIDGTRRRASTFFGEGIVAHVAFADPACPELLAVLAEAVGEVGGTVHRGGTYLCIDGPQFSTRAESRLYRSWGVDVIGMTNATEAKLAREAEICYATLALATDYDCWHDSEEAVSTEVVLRTLRANVALAKRVVTLAARGIAPDRPCFCRSALRDALITDLSAAPPDSLERLRILLKKYL